MSEGKEAEPQSQLEYKSKWTKKMEKYEEKYKDMPKIQIHRLDDEGNLKYMQIKKDMVWTTVGWSFIGNFVGISVVRYIDKNSDKYKNMRQFKKREMMKAFGFLGTVAMFTLWGYGTAR